MSGHGKTLQLQEIKVPLPKAVSRHLSGSYNVGRNKFKRETRKPYGMSKKVWNERRRQVNR